MIVDNAKTGYEIDRKAASKLLKVSMRTVDRYIKAKKLSIKTIDGRIWLSREEVGDFGSKKKSTGVSDEVDMSTPSMSMDRGVDMVDTVEVFGQGNVSTLSSTPRRERDSKGIYRKLFQELREELHEKQERLEIANYRVGQLEAQVKNSVPMLEYHRESYEKRKKAEALRNEIEDARRSVKEIARELTYERFNKRIFLTILLVILALQPLWLLILFR